MTSLQVYSVAMLMISSGEEQKFLNPTLSIKSSSQVHPEELENFKQLILNVAQKNACVYIYNL